MKPEQDAPAELIRLPDGTKIREGADLEELELALDNCQAERNEWDAACTELEDLVGEMRERLEGGAE